MKSRLIVRYVIVLFVIFLVGVLALQYWQYIVHQNVLQTYAGFEITSYTLEGKQKQFLVADTSAKWEKGLMYYRKLPGVDGMIFRFPDKQMRTFWNKNTLMDLTLYWISDGVVVGQSFLPSIEKSKNIVTASSPTPVNTVIELAVKP